jgi:hypothetical protein
MTSTTEDIYTFPTTWNAAAATAATAIWDYPFSHPGIALNEIRLTFNRVEQAFDANPEDTNMLAELWSSLGNVAARYASNSGSRFTAEELTHTLVRKQRDYGHHNILRFGTYGVIVRCHDKIARLEHLQATGQSPQNESVRDNIMDVAGYSAIGIMLATSTFELPLT